MLLKVCGMREIKNIMDLQEQVQPDFMGLIFYPPSPRFVGNLDPTVYHSIQLPKVGVFVDETLESLLKIVKGFQLNGVQLHGKESIAYVSELSRQTDVFIWKVWSVKDVLDWEELKYYEGLVDAFLFDTFTSAHGGSGKVFNWNLLENYPLETPFFLSGGLSVEHVPEIVRLKATIPKMKGVDLNSKFETRPGLKDIAQLLAFKNKIINNEINEGSI